MPDGARSISDISPRLEFEPKLWRWRGELSIADKIGQVGQAGQVGRIGRERLGPWAGVRSVGRAESVFVFKGEFVVSFEPSG